MFKSERRNAQKEARRNKQGGFSQFRKVMEQQKFGANTGIKLHKLASKKAKKNSHEQRRT